MTTRYTLKFNLSSEAIARIQDAGETIFVVKDVQNAALSSAWVTILPDRLATTITITWFEKYFVFGATQEIGPGAIIEYSDERPTVSRDSWLYDGTLSAKPQEAAASIFVDNQKGPANQKSAIGLIQENSTGKAAIGFANAIFNRRIQLTPKLTIGVGLGFYKSNEALEVGVWSSVTPIRYTTAKTTATMLFDLDVNIFVEDDAAKIKYLRYLASNNDKN